MALGGEPAGGADRGRLRGAGCPVGVEVVEGGPAAGQGVQGHGGGVVGVPGAFGEGERAGAGRAQQSEGGQDEPAVQGPQGVAEGDAGAQGGGDGEGPEVSEVGRGTAGGVQPAQGLLGPHPGGRVVQYVAHGARVAALGLLQQGPVVGGLPGPAAGGGVEDRAQQEQAFGAAHGADQAGALHGGFGGGEGAQGGRGDGEGGEGVGHEATAGGWTAGASAAGTTGAGSSAVRAPVCAARWTAAAMCRINGWRSAQYTDGRRKPSPAR